jgi:hypothetical protein
VTTILKALRELERQGDTSGRRISSLPEGEPTRRWRLGLFALAVVAAAGVAVALLSGRRSEIAPAPGEAPAARPASPPAVAAVPEDASPWAYVLPEERAPRAAPAVRPPRAAAAPPLAARSVQPYPGEPRIAVRSIAYAANPGQRAVTLVIDGRAQTLREGESAGDAEVQLILRDSVYIRYRGSVFAASPPR